LAGILIHLLLKGNIMILQNTLAATWADFLLAKMRLSDDVTRECAGRISCTFEGQKMSIEKAADILADRTMEIGDLDPDVQASADYHYAVVVTDAARCMSRQEGEALLRFTGFYGCDLSQMRTSAEKAVRDAAAEFYLQ
jgi:hypothetical protein